MRNIDYPISPMTTIKNPLINNNVRFEMHLPYSRDRVFEGGLRTKGSCKSSYKNKPLISIVTVVFNGEKYLEETILSVLNQSYENLEYIVIDGGSSDGTLDIIRRYEDAIDYWVSESDEGISDAFNKGISLCAGEIIGLINADDWYESDAVENVVEHFGRAGVFCGNVQYWDGYDKDYVFSTNIAGLTREMTVNHAAVFVSKAIYKKYGAFDKRYKYAMDYELLLRFYKNGVEFLAINDVLSNMRMAGVSDANWMKSYNEVRLAKMQYGESVIVATGYYVKQWIRKRVANILLANGLEILVKFYRSRFSIIKKNIDDA